MTHWMDADGPVYVKRTGTSGQYRYWFWNPSLGRMTGRAGQRRPTPQQVNARPHYRHHPWEVHRPLQICDVVFDYERLLFGVLMHGSSREEWLCAYRNGVQAEQAAEHLERITANLLGKEVVAEHANLIGAQTQSELDFAEQIGARNVRMFIEERLPNIPIGEQTLLRLHGEFFADVYDWAGKYRQKDLVVGRHDSPTSPWRDVPSQTKRFFREFRNPLLRQASRSRRHLLEALIEFHREMARIHPFRDGNGRVIRLISEIIALQWGHKLTWDLRAERRRRYHQAVRRAVHMGNDRFLRHILDRALS